MLHLGRFISETLRCAELDITDTMAFIQERRASALVWIKREQYAILPVGSIFISTPMNPSNAKTGTEHVTRNVPIFIAMLHPITHEWLILNGINLCQPITDTVSINCACDPNQNTLKSLHSMSTPDFLFSASLSHHSHW